MKPMQNRPVALTVLILLFSAVIVFGAKNNTQQPKEASSSVSQPIPATDQTVQQQENTSPKAGAFPITGQSSQPNSGPKSPRAGEQINWQVVAAGGGTQTMGQYVLGSTIGQTAVGTSTMGSYNLQSGFWQNFGWNYLCGDADGTGDIDIADAVYLVCYIFLDCAEPSPMAAGDADCDGGITIADVVYLINYIFNDGLAPCANCK